jgi:flagellar hook-basal body complex protein FliE
MGGPKSGSAYPLRGRRAGYFVEGLSAANGSTPAGAPVRLRQQHDDGAAAVATQQASAAVQQVAPPVSSAAMKAPGILDQALKGYESVLNSVVGAIGVAPVSLSGSPELRDIVIAALPPIAAFYVYKHKMGPSAGSIL